MNRTLISRGLVLVSVVATAVATVGTPAFGTADRHAPTWVVARGRWLDPGPVVDNAVPASDPTKLVLTMHGGTHATGEFAGDSTYTMQALYDPATTALEGRAREHYTATLGRRGSGHVTIVERVHTTADGIVVVAGWIAGGDGVFRHARGTATFTGHLATDGSQSSAGTSVLRLRLAR